MLNERKSVHNPDLKLNICMGMNQGPLYHPYSGGSEPQAGNGGEHRGCIRGADMNLKHKRRRKSAR